MKICVYAICKNESQFVQRFCDSAQEADLILIADTGSTDNTIEIAKQCNKTRVFSICVEPWRFDHARTIALALVPDDIDICVCLDLDEVLESGWRDHIEWMIYDEQINMLKYAYDWGNNYILTASKIHRRHGWLWKGICHETLCVDPRSTMVFIETDKILIKHLQDNTKSRSNYLTLLKIDVDQNENNALIRFYYARELAVNQQLTEAILEFGNALKLNNETESFNKGESCVCYCNIARSYALLKDYDNAEVFFNKACENEPDNRYPLVHYAKFYYDCFKNYSASYDLIKKALLLNDKPKVGTYSYDPKHFGLEILDFADELATHLGIEFDMKTIK